MRIAEGVRSEAFRRRRPAALRLGLALACVLAAMACAPSLEDRLERARLNQEIGDLDEAVSQLRDLLDAHPDSAEANLLLGRVQLQRGQPALAIWPLELAARDREWASEAELLLGGAFLRLDQLEPAHQAVSRVLAHSEDPEIRIGALRLRVAILLSQEDWEAGIAESDALLAEFPDDPNGLVLRANALLGADRRDEGIAALERLWSNPSLATSDAALEAGMALVRLYEEADDEAGRVRADAHLGELLERFPARREAVRAAIRAYRRRQEPERGEALLRDLLAQEPGDVWLAGILADQLLARGEEEAAETLVRETVDLLDTPAAWITLAELYRKIDRPEEAVEAMERTLALLPGTPDHLRFKYAGMLSDAGDLARAEEVAREIGEDFYRELTLGRVAHERGEHTRALGHLEKGLRRWPNNAGARLLAARSALRTGDVDRAVDHLREAVRSDAAGTDAALELAWIELGRGRPTAATHALAPLIGAGAGSRLGPALELMVRSAMAREAWEAARERIDRLALVPGFEAEAASLRAEVAEAEEGPQAALAILRDSGLDWSDPDHEAALRSYAQRLQAAGRSEDALALARRASEAHPAEASLHDLLGRLLHAAGRADEARIEFDRALALEPEHPGALEALGRLAESAGERERAVALLRRSFEADWRNAATGYGAAQILLQDSRFAEARVRLEAVLGHHPFHTEAANDLAWILAIQGRDLDRALGLARRAAERDPRPEILDTLGYVHLKRGEAAEAVVSLERAHAGRPDAPSIAYRLGLALNGVGETDRARAIWLEALEQGPFPEAQQARDQISRLDTLRARVPSP